MWLLKINSYLNYLLNIIFPAFCPICKIKISPQDQDICKDCLARLEKTGLPVCISRKNKQFFFEKTLSVFAYSGIARKCLHLIKYRRKTRLAKALAELMASFLDKHINTNDLDVIVAVPLHRAKFSTRGFNQAQILANTIGRRFNIPCSCGSLLRIKKTGSQFDLSRKERLANVGNAFKCTKDHLFKNKKILLVDDIFTTGATLNECSRILKIAGAEKITTFTFARQR
ncbi:MAG: ComF family protein [Candidatus Omnitrophota bacterium]